MTLLGLIAFMTGTLGVWLTIRQNIWCWPMAIISTVAAGVEFFEARLFGDMSLQVVYFFAGVYGWVYWDRHKGQQFVVSRLKPRWWPALLAVTLLQWVLYYQLLLSFHGARPLLDAALTALSLTTTYMMTRKWVENWLLWVLIDATYIVLYWITELWLYALLYAVFAGVAFYGWIKWRKAV